MSFIRSLYIANRFFQLAAFVAVAFVLSFILDGFILVPKILFTIGVALMVADLLLLYRAKRGISAHRFTPEKLSNGDENEIRIYIENFFPYDVTIDVIDEVPHQFQKRDLNFGIVLEKGSSKTLTYFLRPVKRGEYSFGAVNILASTPLSLFRRKFRFSNDALVPVYPSYLQMRKYELLAISNRLTEAGIKKIRRIGHNMEFELIKEYVPGDDFRSINWKATARKSTLMVNHFQDERSQQVYSLIDKGRVMQMPFDGMSLMDYAINACLVISNIAIRKSDKPGLLTFQDNVGTYLPATGRNSQMSRIQEVLYNQKTGYRESDFSVVHACVSQRIAQRSLLLVFTNFESLYGMERQLPYLKSMAIRHLVVVIFFENTELTELITAPAEKTRDIYQKAVAEKFAYDKRLIVKELRKHGIQAILTPPDQLTVNTINKYLELKARGIF